MVAAAAGVSGATRRAVPDAWLRSFWLWDLYFALALAATVVLVLTGGRSAGARAAAVALLLLGAVAYVVAGRAVVRRERPGRSGGVWTAIVSSLLVAVVALVPDGLWALFVVVPQVFMSVPLPVAAAVTAALNLLPPLRALLDGETADLLFLVPLAALLAVFGVLVGRWIDLIIAQSRERAGLITQLEASREEVAALSARTAAAAERERIARDIHDTLAQGFASIHALLQAAGAELDDEPELASSHVELAARAARENLEEARALMTGLVPAPLESASLPDALARHTERVGAEAGVHAEAATGGEPRPLPAAVAVVLLRTAQEALANVAKHAAARSVCVRLDYRDDAVALRVTDDGRGFDPGTAADGFGLPGMRVRLAQVGGHLELRTAPGGGTALLAEVPAP